jgi:tetratricopeptide (TPR) repeat protein
MSSNKFFSIFLFFLLGLIVTSLKNDDSLRVTVAKPVEAIACGPGVPEDFEVAEDGKFITALPGWGNHSYRISTSHDSAQFYFNQGLNMYYSYHAKEAVASFKEAARFDSSCALAYWGQALAMGPTYNFAHGYVMRQTVPAVLELMNKSRPNASDKEKDLIDVMNKRYLSDSSDSQRKTLNQSYARGLRELVVRYPDDDDIKALYVDAVMLIHPWNFWNNDGSSKEWTPELVNLCETILKNNPNHPGALHYYIHVTEASRNPTVALATADVLKDLLPGVAHMVHMSSHVYERTGLYAKGVNANDKADEDLVRYDSLAKNLNLRAHVPHYFAVQSYCALSGAMYKKAIPMSIRCRNITSPSYDETYDQYLYMMPALAMVRLGKWKEIIADKVVPNQRWPYASLLYDFAKGMAFVKTGNLELATKHLDQLRQKAEDSILKIRNIPFNTPYEGALIAENILNASILFSEKKSDAAISALKKAITVEDKMIYVEPKDWMIPARQYLGAFLLKLGRPLQAEQVYREDLEWNPGNGWSLLGLYQSLKAQGKQKDADQYKKEFMNSFSHADVIPPASVY